MIFSISILSFVSGVLLHLLVFSRNEWDRHAPRVFLTFCLAALSIFVSLTLGWRYRLGEALGATSMLMSSVLAGLFTSMMVYRLVFHPLRSFAGPIGARVSAFWITKENIPNMTFYRKLPKLHDQYGDFVRIRPREISIRHPDAIVDVHGSKNRILKGEFYEHNYPQSSLQMTRDATYHKTQRKYWDKAFHAKGKYISPDDGDTINVYCPALAEYIPRLEQHYRLTMGILTASAAAGRSIDTSKVLLDLFFDVISDLLFGKSFDTQKGKKRNLIMDDFLAQQKFIGFVVMNTWPFLVARLLPPAQANMKKWTEWYGAALEERKQMTPSSPDLYTYISQSVHFATDSAREAELGLIAGADTNAITISNACQLLCCYPAYQSRLHNELKDLPIVNGIIDDKYLASTSLLVSIIFETLRLLPPVPSGLQRVTPPEGATIAGRFIPGSMIISTPTYAIQRDSRAFVQPEDFIPERWTSRPELVLRKDAFVAFGYGNFSCAGRSLAMMQMRMVLAMIVRRFEISIPPGQEADFERFIEDQADCFSLHLQPLPLMFKDRAHIQ